MRAKLPIREVKTAVREMNLGFSESSEFFRSAVLLLSGLVVGHNPRVLAAYTGYSERFIMPRATRLRKAGIWHNGQTYASWEEPEGETTFLLDVLVAEGVVNRTWRPAPGEEGCNEF